MDIENSKYSETFRIVSEAINGFSRKAVETAINVILALNSRGVTSEDLLAFVKETNDLGAVEKEKSGQEFWSQYNMACPNCGYWLERFPIYIPKGKANLFGYKGLWFCDKCNYEQFTTEELKDGNR